MKGVLLRVVDQIILLLVIRLRLNKNLNEWPSKEVSLLNLPYLKNSIKISSQVPEFIMLSRSKLEKNDEKL